MELEKIFNDLESNQNHESEEAKKKLAEQFTLSKYCVQILLFAKLSTIRVFSSQRSMASS